MSAEDFLWRSLEELPGEHRSSPAPEPEAPMSEATRRQFLGLAGGTLALAGLGACTRQPTETILPYVVPPERIVPGKPLY
ncbi:MAG: twin-arginine translocation signal domain-containing protein, partial [Vicinamibacteria bacterium]